MAKNKNQNDEKQNKIMPAIGITAMKKLFLSLAISSAAYAMDGEDIRNSIPERVSMQEEAPSFISKELHKSCCSLCCGLLCVVPWVLFDSSWVATIQFSHQECGDSFGCQVLASKGGAKSLSLVGGAIVPLTLGYAAGLQLGKKTFKLDQQLKAKIDGQKQKSE